MNLLFLLSAVTCVVLHQEQPSIKNIVNIADPFDSTNSTLCWKRRNCIDVRDELSTFTGQMSKHCTFVDCGGDFPVQCGIGCALSEEDCKNDLYHKITSVSEFAYNIGQVIIAATQSPDGSTSPNALISLEPWLKNVIEGFARAALTHFLFISLGEENAKKLADQIIGRAFGDTEQTVDWSIADPTGVANVVQAFWKPFCPIS